VTNPVIGSTSGGKQLIRIRGLLSLSRMFPPEVVALESQWAEPVARGMPILPFAATCKQAILDCPGFQAIDDRAFQVIENP